MLKLDWNMVFNMVNILILYLLMKKFLFGPISEIMEKRSNTITTSLMEAENKNKDALQLKQDFEKMLETADEKAASIIKEAEQRALEEHDKQIIATKEEITKMIEEANKSIELERKKSMEEIQSEIANIAIAAAVKVIQKNVDSSTNDRIINDFLQEAGVGK
jgi:F-type H+-transporting ATPase subunit b